MKFDRLTSLFEGIKYTFIADRVAAVSHIFDDDFQLNLQLK
ncbi:MAG: hypothetical protein ABN478_09525 [Mixta sp.]